MIIVLDWIKDRLSTQPEYGMGYQKAIANLDDGSTKTGLIFNGQVFFQETEDSSLVVREEWNNILRDAGESKRSIQSVKLIPRPPDTLRGVKRIVLGASTRTLLGESVETTRKSVGPAKDGPEIPTIDGESSSASPPILMTFA